VRPVCVIPFEIHVETTRQTGPVYNWNARVGFQKISQAGNGLVDTGIFAKLWIIIAAASPVWFQTRSVGVSNCEHQNVGLNCLSPAYQTELLFYFRLQCLRGPIRQVGNEVVFVRW